MTLKDLFSLRAKMLQDFEDNFSKMSFANETEKNNYYHAYMDGMTEFFVHSMISIMDSEDISNIKAA